MLDGLKFVPNLVKMQKNWERLREKMENGDKIGGEKARSFCLKYEPSWWLNMSMVWRDNWWFRWKIRSGNGEIAGKNGDFEKLDKIGSKIGNSTGKSRNSRTLSVNLFGFKSRLYSF